LAEFTDVPVTLRMYGGGNRPGIAHLRVWPPRERTFRTLKGVLGCWSASFICLFIPAAHLFLTPAFFIGGLVILARWPRQARTLVHVTGECPACKREQRFGVRGNYALPKETTCPDCRARVTVLPLGGPDVPPLRGT
jgi:hypothetical protein